MSVCRYQGGELELFRGATTWKSYFAGLLRPYVGRRVLEVGAGIGGTTRVLCSGREAEWLCLEPDAELVSVLERSRSAGQLPAVCRIKTGTVADLDRAECYDTILYIDVLEHIETDAAEIAGAAELLRPGGYLAVLSPAFPWLFTEFDAAIGHHRRYTRATLSALAPPSLVRRRCCYLDSVGLLASLANRLLLRASMPTKAQIRLWDRSFVPLSMWVDRLLGHSVGRSILAVWEKV